MTSKNSILVILSSLSLVACHGSNSDITPGSFQDTEKATPSDITGFGLASNTDTGARSTEVQSGTYNHGSKKAVLNSETADINTSDDYVDYKYLRGFSATQDASKTQVSLGILGILSPTSDLPTANTELTWTGETSANFTRTGNSSFNLEDGKAAISANFSTGVMSVTLGDFAAKKLDNFAGALPFDTIELKDIDITGNQFGDGTVSLEKDGAAVAALNGGTSSIAGGFFGPVEDGQPGEVGGVYSLFDTNLKLQGSFAGKK